MAKLADIIKTSDKAYGAGIVTLGAKMVDLERLPTGVFPFDLSSGGGWPQGKICEIYGPESSGKCHAAGTKILMFDGSMKVVEDIVPGDEVMGVDSLPRVVTGIGTGHGKLYSIVPVKGNDPFTVNEEHMLSLVCTHNQGDRKVGDVVNISLKDYLQKSKDWKIYHHLYRVGVDFPEEKVPLDAYFLGLWLGDGNSRAPAITTEDTEIIDWLQNYADSNGWFLTPYTAENRCTSYAVVGDRQGNAKESYAVPKTILLKMGLIQNKRIPQRYLHNSREVRLSLLAGLIDSDGTKGTGNSMVFYNVNKELCEDVLFLARSLGYYGSLAPKKGSYNCEAHWSWQVYISGDMKEVPLLLERKRPAKRLRKGTPLTSRFVVDEVGNGAYYGFELEGDHLYLLDSFIVNHNTNLALKTIGIYQKMFPGMQAAFVDAEHAFNSDWARCMGVDTDALVMIQPTYAEQAVDLIEGLLLAEDIGLVIVDSIAALVTTAQIEKSAEGTVMGGNSALIGTLVKKALISQTRAAQEDRYPTLICINQIRFKIGVMFGDPETRPGGKALPFQSSMSVRCYGKNIMENSVSKTMPTFKETKTQLTKWKVPIVSVNSVYQMNMIPYNGNAAGGVDDWNTVMAFAKNQGMLVKNDKLWVIGGMGFKTLVAVKEYFDQNPDTYMSLRQEIISQAVQAAQGGLPSEMVEVVELPE